jgi:hypothetical protein
VNASGRLLRLLPWIMPLLLIAGAPKKSHTPEVSSTSAFTAHSGGSSPREAHWELIGSQAPNAPLERTATKSAFPNVPADEPATMSNPSSVNAGV